jgi:transposase
VEYGAIDLHKKESQIRIVTADGEVLDRRIVTTQERFTAVFWGRARMRILIEASTESEWVAQHLESLGHDVIVADPNYGAMYALRSRRVKTDLRDAAALVDACQRGNYRPAHRRSARQRGVQAMLNVRRELTDSRTRAISLARAITRGAGFRIRGGRAETFLDRLAALELPAAMTATLLPLRSVIEVFDDELAASTDQFMKLAAADPVATRLMTVPSIGPITATAFIAAGLRAWAAAIAQRRGKKVAMVALARRLARILFGMWRDQTEYQAKRVRPLRPTPATGDGVAKAAVG